MEGNSETIASTQKKLLASHDPGWNDPPSWALSQSQNSDGGTPTKRVLNKRIAFPLNSTKESSSSPLCQNMPPVGNLPPPTEIGTLTTAPHKPISVPTARNVEDSNTDIQINKAEALKESLDNLQYLMKYYLQDPSKAEEIQKRIDRMEIMWNEDKLNNDIQKKLLEISKALKECNFKKADQIHLSLMMSNASVCSSWIPGIRQLITEILKKQENVI